MALLAMLKRYLPVYSMHTRARTHTKKSYHSVQCNFHCILQSSGVLLVTENRNSLQTNSLIDLFLPFKMLQSSGNHRAHKASSLTSERSALPIFWAVLWLCWVAFSFLKKLQSQKIYAHLVQYLLLC